MRRGEEEGEEGGRRGRRGDERGEGGGEELRDLLSPSVSDRVDTSYGIKDFIPMHVIIYYVYLSIIL